MGNKKVKEAVIKVEKLYLSAYVVKEKNILEIQKRRYFVDLCVHCKDPKTISDFAILQYQDG
jgi:predicted nucleic-acid-binding Zn-ribbon protein